MLETVADFEIPSLMTSPASEAFTRLTVCKISPIWQVTAVQGRQPMKAPRKQSFSDTPVNPQAMLSPDHGTTPTSRRTDKRTHAGELLVDDIWLDFSDSVVADPSRAVRVIWTGRGKKRVRTGASGVASKVANTDPIDVSIVINNVANRGWKRAPARTF